MGRCIAALGVAAVMGGAATVAVFAASAFLPPMTGPSLEAHAGFELSLLSGWLWFGVIATIVWAAGLFVIGAPVWALMHQAGLTRRFHAMVVAALIAGVAGYVVGALAFAPFPVAWFLAFSIIGLCVGWMIWAVTYGRNRRTPGPSE